MASAIFQVLLTLKRVLTQAQVTNYAGTTNIGNMTGGGGLASVFDGTTTQAYAASAQGPAGAAGYVGKQWAASKVMSQAVVYDTDGTSTVHWNSGSNSDTITLTLYGKQTAPTGATDGTSLGSNTIVNGTTTNVTVTSTDQLTAWAYNWITITSSAYAGGKLCISEVIFYEMV